MSFTEKELELIEVLKKYGSRVNFRKKRPILHQRLEKTKIEIIHAAFGSKKFWTKEECLSFAIKYRSVSEWGKKHRNSLVAAQRNGFMAECTQHMIKLTGFWTKEECKKVAKNCKSIKQFHTKYKGAYAASKKLGFFEEITKHLEGTRNNKLVDYKPVILSKIKRGCKTRNDLGKTIKNALAHLLKKDQSFRQKIKKLKPEWFTANRKAIQCVETGKIYKSVNIASRSLKISRYNLDRHLQGKDCYVKGYTFKYIKEKK